MFTFVRGIRILSTLGLAALITLGVAHAQGKEPIKIGWLSSLTGPLSSAAIAENKGVEFAVDEINKRGGILGRPDRAAHPRYCRRADQGGQFRQASSSIPRQGAHHHGASELGQVPSDSRPIIAKAGVPNLILAALEALTDPVKYPRAFRAIDTNAQWIKAANDYAIDVFKKQKIAIVGDTSGLRHGEREAADGDAREARHQAGLSQHHRRQQDRISPTRSPRCKAAGADVIMPWSAATGLLARMLNTRGDMQWDVPVVGHPALMALPVKPLLNKPEYWSNAFGPAISAQRTTSRASCRSATTELMDKLRPALGGDIDFTFWWVQVGYDSVKVIEHAITKAGSTDPAAIEKAMERDRRPRRRLCHLYLGPDEAQRLSRTQRWS